MNATIRTSLACAVAALTMAFAAPAEAQTYGSGYQFGLGFSQGTSFYNGRGVFPGYRNNYPYGNGVFRGGFFRGGGIIHRHEAPPYFAQFPPVYYSGIVKRPYGISPYAVPPGVAPIEMQVAPTPERVGNPYFESPVEAPVVPHVELPSDETGEVQEVQEVQGDQNTSATWTVNPYKDWTAVR